MKDVLDDGLCDERCPERTSARSLYPLNLSMSSRAVGAGLASPQDSRPFLTFPFAEESLLAVRKKLVPNINLKGRMTLEANQ